MDSLPLWGLRVMTILAASIIALMIGSPLNLPLPAILLVAIGCYTLLDIIRQIPNGASPRRRRG
ncbi:MAG: hypothetical protein Q7J09_02725 [Methanocalculus sp.]|uniref:hypothetical protein n=1 Tax=Methanocalculus sp. TaxID=2004547 RepID=UPI002719BA72|nr:hypothetical protein [Methanocalculus sp.]MDO9538904.1 hypothetical protein [Methanocalculus sp.]